MKCILCCTLVVWLVSIGFAQTTKPAANTMPTVEPNPSSEVASMDERVNLGRTSLASVVASSVNGDRSMDNRFYGILKAFDDGGKPEDNGITYSNWLAQAGDTRPWVEVRFDEPVMVQSLVIEGGPAFRAELTLSGGEVEYVAKGEAVRKLEKLYKGVKAVRLTFEPSEKEAAAGPVRVDEIRVLGFVPKEVKYTVGDPRLLVTARTAELATKDAFRVWQAKMLGEGVKAETKETKEAFVTTYRKGDVELLRVVVRKSDGKVTMDTLAKLEPVEKGDAK